MISTSSTSISAIINGGRPLSPGMLARITSAIPDANKEYLLTGKGDTLIKSNAREVGGAYSVMSGDSEAVMVDYVPASASATFVESLSNWNEWEDKYPIIPSGDERREIDQLKIFEVEGDSMYPTLVSGSLILAKEISQSSWHYAEGVVVAVYREFVVVKRIAENKLHTENYIVLSSDNERYGKKIVQLADLRALYQAKRILSSPIS